MNEELISAVAELLCEWNPLGEKANSTPDLEGYRYEAMDILSSVIITKDPIEKAVSDVLTQAFKISLDASKLSYYSKKIDQLSNEQ